MTFGASVSASTPFTGSNSSAVAAVPVAEARPGIDRRLRAKATSLSQGFFHGQEFIVIVGKTRTKGCAGNLELGRSRIFKRPAQHGDKCRSLAD